MPGYSVTLVAQADIEDIVRHIGGDNPKAAERFQDDLYEAFDHLAANPHLGHRRSDLTNRPVFFLTVGRFSYVIIYKKVSPVQILRVVHWHRDVTSLSLDEPTE
jgi:toxin ParE1/3/4